MKPPPGMVFIYALIGEGEGPRYIGVTKRALKDRLDSHRWESRRATNAGKKRTPEQRERMRAAQLARYIEKSGQ